MYSKYEIRVRLFCTKSLDKNDIYKLKDKMLTWKNLSNIPINICHNSISELNTSQFITQQMFPKSATTKRRARKGRILAD